MDLGNVLQTVGGFIPGTDIFDVGAGIYNLVNTNQGQSTSPVTTSTGATAMATTLNSGCASKGTYRVVTTYDAATGQPIKQACAPKRRRRRRLATASDIRDLSSLKSILGNGETFKMWIATRGR